jgi:pyruvate dehydrogenase E1 component alpha subunit/2-oxoisovalerate dehydrogenase E1 component alpha subunit
MPEPFDSASPAPVVERRTKLELYAGMRTNRMVEERLVNLQRQGKVVGGLFRSLGQEGVSVGSASALEPQDYLGALIRNLGSVLVRGYRPRDVFEQYMARGSSPTRGRDLNLHFGSHEHRVIAPISMLGRLIPVMAGVALAGRMQGKNLVALTYIGDGGTSTGDFHEGLNIAAVWRLPFVLLCENNGYAYSTPTSRQMACARIVDKAVGYGIPGVRVDGNDVEAVYLATREAVARARSGGGPTLLECLTFRRCGHAEHDDQRYVPKELLESWAARDPIDSYVGRLLAEGSATADELAAIDSRLAKEIEGDLAEAEGAPDADPSTLLHGVYEDDSIARASSRGWWEE